MLQLYSNKLNDKINFHTSFVTSVQNRLKVAHYNWAGLIDLLLPERECLGFFVLILLLIWSHGEIIHFINLAEKNQTNFPFLCLPFFVFDCQAGFLSVKLFGSTHCRIRKEHQRSWEGSWQWGEQSLNFGALH